MAKTEVSAFIQLTNVNVTNTITFKVPTTRTFQIHQPTVRNRYSIVSMVTSEEHRFDSWHWGPPSVLVNGNWVFFIRVYSRPLNPFRLPC